MARVKIEEELRRCTEELKRCGVEGSPDLKVLESELFGGMKGQKERHVGVMMGGHARDNTFRSAYTVEGDNPLVLDDLNEVHSCLSGGLYKDVRIPDTKIHKELKSMEYEGEVYKIVAHWTTNRKQSRKVCSISLFDSSDVFLAYVFTTNDPLAFDNFNCYRGEADIVGKPQLECVEQLVFCNNKVQLARKYLRSLEPEDVKKALTPTNYHLKFWVKILGNPDLRDEIQRLEVQRPTDKNASNFKVESKRIDDEQLSLLLAHYEHYGHLLYKSKYERYLDETETYAHDLIPGDFYKTAGRNVIMSKDFLENVWESIAMPCVIGARLRQLRRSAHERKLTAAMIPKCVIECSEFDHIWAWLRPKGVSMEDLIDSKFDLLIEKVKDVVAYQQNFINSINSAGSSERIADILFDKKNKEKLGLSEKFIQSLWTGEIELPVSNKQLQEAVRKRLLEYGIDFDLYNPILKKSGFNAYSVAGAVGSFVIPAGPEKQ